MTDPAHPAAVTHWLTPLPRDADRGAWNPPQPSGHKPPAP
jgi:hypothetical protein